MVKIAKVFQKICALICIIAIIAFSCQTNRIIRMEKKRGRVSIFFQNVHEIKMHKKTKMHSKMLSARFELAIFRVSGERIDQLSHESAPLTELI
jgi:hypothetical protein